MMPEEFELVMGVMRPILNETPHRFPEDWTEEQKAKARKARGSYMATKRGRNAKERAFDHYCNGLPCCAHCGITDIRVLCLHHINGDGKERRKKYGGTLSYTKLENEGYPVGLLALCANCHLIIHSKY